MEWTASSRAFLTSLVACGLPVAGAAQSTVQVLPGEPVTIDGVLADREWRGASVPGPEDVRIMLQVHEGFMDVGLRTPPLLVASLCIERADEIHVFHSSSAVGRAMYSRTGTGWNLVEPFEWRLRGTGEGAAAPEEQAAHLQDHGWVANTVVTGNAGETEFRISSTFLDGSPIRVALGLLLEGDGSEVRGWPMGAGEDGCTQRSTVAGPLPDRVVFDPDSWVRLELPGGPPGSGDRGT